MSTVLVAAWVILGLLWVVTVPGFGVAFAAIGDPPRGFLPGWSIAFLGWLSIPVAVVVSVVAILRGGTGGLLAWLPIFSIVTIPAGYLVAVVGAAVVARLSPEGSKRERIAHSQNASRPASVDLSVLDDAALNESQLALVSRAVDVWFPADYVGGIDPAFPRLVLDTVRDGLDGEPVRRALDGLVDYEAGTKFLRPPGRQAAFAAVARLARLSAVGGPDQLVRRDDAAHLEVIRLAEFALREIARPAGE